MTQLQGTTVLLTGAAGGFGSVLTRRLLEEGARLVLTDREVAPLEALAGEHAGESGEVLHCLAADLGTAEGIEALAQAVEAAGIEVEVLINNAGIAQYGLFHQVPEEQWETLMAVNLLAPMRLVRRFLPGMVNRGRGHVVNISSVAGWTAAAGIAPYNASKYGLRGFGEALALEYGQRGIAITNVYPFFSRTPILDSPGFGELERPGLPDRFVLPPEQIVEAMIDGIRHDRLHVFTDRFGRMTHRLVRWAPWALGWLRWRMERARAQES
jgi:short-subunit dehydrogenase